VFSVVIGENGLCWLFRDRHRETSTSEQRTPATPTARVTRDTRVPTFQGLRLFAATRRRFVFCFFSRLVKKNLDRSIERERKRKKE